MGEEAIKDGALADKYPKRPFLGGEEADRRKESPGWYNGFMLPEIELDDILRLRKPHPCGSYDWKVVRLGADIGLECLGCQRRVLLPRRELAHRLKTILPREKPDRENQ